MACWRPTNVLKYIFANISRLTLSSHTIPGECISGALWWKDVFSLAEEIGFTTPRLVTASVVEIDKPELKAAVGR